MPTEILLEREYALAQLGELAQRSGHGAGQVVLLRGEAGVGKTAVIRRFTASLDGQGRVLRGNCDPLATPRPLGPLIDMLAQLPKQAAARLAAAIDGGAAEATYDTLLKLFGNGDTWVCVMEDVHWADGATLDVLRFLVRRAASLPLLLVASYRDDEVGPQHPLTVTLGDVATCEALTRIELSGLSRDAVAVLADGRGLDVDELHRRTGGNPYFVTEILAADPGTLKDGALPRSVSEAVWGRLARLSAPARDMAYAAAICGPQAGTRLLEQVCPSATEAALGECLDAGVLRVEGAAVSFRHELARQATLEQIPDHRRRELHMRALNALAQPPIPPDTLSALAFHADHAGDAAAAVRYGPVAAERAAAVGAHRQAAELYELALRHADPTQKQRNVVWLERHAFASYLCGLVEAAVRSLREAIALRHELGDVLSEGDNLRWLSHLLWPLGRSTEATVAAHASLRLLENHAPCPQLAWSLVNLAQLAAVSYDPAAARYADRAIALGTQLGEHAVVIRARIYAALATVLRTHTGWDELEATWRAAVGSAALAEHAGIAGAIMCWTAALHHDLDRADRYITETSSFSEERDLGTFQIIALGASALVALHRGDWDRAEAAANEVLNRPGLSPLHRAMPLLTLTLIRARRGEPPVAPQLGSAPAAAEPPDLFHLGPVWAARAEAAWLRGDDAAARAEAEIGLAAAPAEADPWLVGHLRRWLHLSGGQPPEAPDSELVTPYHLEISGDWRAAAAAWTALGCPYDAAIAQLGGDPLAVETALATFRTLGARAAASRARHRLTQIRGRTPHPRLADTRADPHQLTRRERGVLELLSDGHSDAEIATMLSISPKTVSNHVSAIFAKLGVHNRTQAAAYAPPPSTEA